MLVFHVYQDLRVVRPGSRPHTPDMKRRRFSARGALSGILLLTLCHADAGDTIDGQISAVENGLLLEITVKGRPLRFLALDERMRHHGVPGVSLAVIDNGRTAWARGYGVANVRTREPVTTETLFQAASVSKPVAAMAALLLVDAGRAPLDGNVNDELRTWRVPESDYTRDSKVTLRRLLSHTAGLNMGGFPGYEVGTTLPTLTQIFEGEPPANNVPIRVRAVPGRAWSYSGGGYLVVQQWLQDITGRPFAEFVATALFETLDMSRSTFDQPLSEHLARAAATGHSADREPVPGGWHVYPELAAAGLWTTPSDLSRLIAALQSSLSGSDNSILSRKMARRMVTPQQADWGLGFSVETTADDTWFAHTGHNEGFTCYVFAYADSGQGAVVMANADQADALVMEIFRSIAHVYDWPDFQPEEIAVAAVDPSVYDRYRGEYAPLNFDGPAIVVRRDGNRLFGRFFGEWLEMLPKSETDYFIPGNGMAVTFPERADDGAQEINLMLPELPLFTLEAQRVE